MANPYQRAAKKAGKDTGGLGEAIQKASKQSTEAVPGKAAEKPSTSRRTTGGGRASLGRQSTISQPGKPAQPPEKKQTAIQKEIEAAKREEQKFKKQFGEGGQLKSIEEMDTGRQYIVSRNQINAVRDPRTKQTISVSAVERQRTRKVAEGIERKIPGSLQEALGVKTKPIKAKKEKDFFGQVAGGVSAGFGKATGIIFKDEPVPLTRKTQLLPFTEPVEAPNIGGIAKRGLTYTASGVAGLAPLSYEIITKPTQITELFIGMGRGIIERKREQLDTGNIGALIAETGVEVGAGVSVARGIIGLRPRAPGRISIETPKGFKISEMKTPTAGFVREVSTPKNVRVSPKVPDFDVRYKTTVLKGVRATKAETATVVVKSTGGRVVTQEPFEVITTPGKIVEAAKGRSTVSFEQQPFGGKTEIRSLDILTEEKLVGKPPKPVDAVKLTGKKRTVSDVRVDKGLIRRSKADVLDLKPTDTFQKIPRDFTDSGAAKLVKTPKDFGGRDLAAELASPELLGRQKTTLKSLKTPKRAPEIPLRTELKSVRTEAPRPAKLDLITTDILADVRPAATPRGPAGIAAVPGRYSGVGEATKPKGKGIFDMTLKDRTERRTLDKTLQIPDIDVKTPQKGRGRTDILQEPRQRPRERVETRQSLGLIPRQKPKQKTQEEPKITIIRQFSFERLLKETLFGRRKTRERRTRPSKLPKIKTTFSRITGYQPTTGGIILGKKSKKKPKGLLTGFEFTRPVITKSSKKKASSLIKDLL